MSMAVWRIVMFRVRPHVLLTFECDDHNGTRSASSPGGRKSFVSKCRRGWREDCSLFSWADKGQWEAIQGENRPASREDDWFRIGFEPVFVDYTKRGIWFVMISLFEVGSWSLTGAVRCTKRICCFRGFMFF